MNKKLFLPLALFLVLLLFAGFFVIAGDSGTEVPPPPPHEGAPEILSAESETGAETEADPLPLWIPPGPPRWFRSNAGGMTLEETPSRLAALRNRFALVIDYVPSYELEPRLLPFFKDEYTIETRVLYEKGKTSRRQWLFFDEAGNIRLNAVFKPQEEASELAELRDDEIFDNDFFDEDIFIEEDESAPAPSASSDDASKPAGFIEIFNEQGRIAGSYNLFENGGDIFTEYFYNSAALVKTETQKKDSGGGEYHAMYTDVFRYNRSRSLRHVERVYHAEQETGPVRLGFPSRVLDAAANDEFLQEKLTLTSDFFGSYSAEEGFRITFDTDSRGRIITQSLFNKEDEEVWTINNTWAGDRITSVKKTEGDEEWITEYEYNENGDRVVQRDVHNGVLERLVYTEGEKETEELFLNGVAVLRAYWENGRKTGEERIRR